MRLNGTDAAPPHSRRRSSSCDGIRHCCSAGHCRLLAALADAQSHRRAPGPVCRHLVQRSLYLPEERISAFAVVPGALIGALPPIIGWTAGGGSPLDPSGIVLCFFLFHLAGSTLLAPALQIRRGLREGRTAFAHQDLRRAPAGQPDLYLDACDLRFKPAVADLSSHLISLGDPEPHSRQLLARVAGIGIDTKTL